MGRNKEQRLLTTTQLAAELQLAPSTIRHYRSAGRLKPTEQTPGGHARWDAGQARRALGLREERVGTMMGLKVDTFAPAGVTHISSHAPVSRLPAEMIALGVREVPAATTDAAHHRWGGGLLRPRIHRATT